MQMVRQPESERGCYDQRKDTAHKHNSTTLMAAGLGVIVSGDREKVQKRIGMY